MFLSYEKPLTAHYMKTQKTPVSIVVGQATQGNIDARVKCVKLIASGLLQETVL